MKRQLQWVGGFAALIAIVYQRLDQPDQAFVLFQQALPIAQSIPHPHLEAHITSQIQEISSRSQSRSQSQ